MASFTNSTSIGELVGFGLSYILPYILPYLFFTQALPISLARFGFTPAGIPINSIASWIQSRYGASYLFSLLQSFGARGGIPNPISWSFISGSLWKNFKSLITRPTNSGNIFKNEKPNHSNSIYEIFSMPLVGLSVFFLLILVCFCWSRYNRLQTIISTRMRSLRSQNRHSTATIETPIRRPQRTATTARNIGQTTPLKVIQILPRNLNNTYTCPKCTRQFRPQGISNHVKSCALEWCRTNGILPNRNSMTIN